jgi:hypothetical protein
MKRQESKKWTLLFAALATGSVSLIGTCGCKPQEQAVAPKESGQTAEPAAPDSPIADAAIPSETATRTPTVPVEVPPAAAVTPLETATKPDAAVANKEMKPGVPVAKIASAADPATKLDASEKPSAETALKTNPAKKSDETPKSAKETDEDANEDAMKVMTAGGDWPQWGGTQLRNNTPNAENLPSEWKVGKFDRKTGEWDSSTAKNIKWVTQLGSQSYGNPVIANGQVYVGTNNGAGYISRYPAAIDLGCLLCFSDKDGKFLWQHSSEKLPTGRVHDWPLQGICCSPLVQGDRLWFVTSRGEVRCLDTQGFIDDEDDGPVTNEPARVLDIEQNDAAFKSIGEALDASSASTALIEMLKTAGEPVEGDVSVEVVEAGKQWKLTGNFDGTKRSMTARVAGPRITIMKPLTVADKEEADVVWSFDMMKQLGVSQHNMCSCSVTAIGDLLFVCTGNGVDEAHAYIPSPDAPSFLCMNKHSGDVYWTDKSPGVNVLHGQWSSPAVGELGGVAQAIFAGGDGWCYSFKADAGADGQPELLWKFDANPKESVYTLTGATRNHIIGTPVIYDGMVYLAVGEDPEHGEGDGHLWCVDPTKRGDVSPQLAVKIAEGERTPIPHKRIQAVEPEKGEAAVDNPNSAVVWHYASVDRDGDGEMAFEETMHRTIGSVVIKDDRLYVADLSGLFHCLDAKGDGKGGPKVYWTYDMLAQSWGSPLIADGKVYIGDEDGDVAVFEHGSEDGEPISEINMGTSVYSTPTVANNVLYIATKDRVFAIAQP